MFKSLSGNVNIRRHVEETDGLKNEYITINRVTRVFVWGTDELVNNGSCNNMHQTLIVHVVDFS